MDCRSSAATSGGTTTTQYLPFHSLGEFTSNGTVTWPSTLIIAPGVYDALSARICEMVGFEAVSHSGYGTAAATLGQPDIGLLDMTEMARQDGSVANAVETPVLGDADTGFGNAVNAYRTVQEYIRAGAAGLFIEDQALPKRCGHMRGKQVISKREMLGKLKAAMDARDERDPDFVIMCRTDAIAVNGFEDALDRAKAAVDLGVDMIFVEAMETREQMERVGREIRAPLMLNLVEGGRTPLMTYKEAEEMGFKYVVPALTALSAAATAWPPRSIGPGTAYGVIAATWRIRPFHSRESHGWRHPLNWRSRPLGLPKCR